MNYFFFLTKDHEVQASIEDRFEHYYLGECEMDVEDLPIVLNLMQCVADGMMMRWIEKTNQLFGPKTPPIGNN